VCVRVECPDGRKDKSQRPPGQESRGTRGPRHADQGQRGRVGRDPSQHFQELGERTPAAEPEGGGLVAGFVHRGAAVRAGGGPQGASAQAGVEQEARQPASLPGERHHGAQCRRAGRSQARQYR
jgi:hypothetical protein